MDKDLHYLTYDPEAIWEEIMVTYVDHGGDVMYGGDEKEILMRAMQAIAVQAFAGVDNALRMATLRYAQGDYLILLGEERGCVYQRAIAANGEVELALRETGRVQTVEAGTVITADGERYYKLAAEIRHDGQAQSVRIGIECTEAGALGNGLMVGTEMDMVRANAAIESIIVTRETAGGTEAEDLELYRERVRASGMASVTTGPKERYVAEARAVSAHIIDANAVQTAPGEVAVLLLLDDDTLADEIIGKVFDALNSVSVRPLTDTVKIALADVKPYDLRVAYLLDPMDTGSTREALEAAVREYLAWQNMVIGRAFDPYRLIAALYQAGALRAYVTDGSSFDGEPAEYTQVDEMTRLQGSVTLEAIP